MENLTVIDAINQRSSKRRYLDKAIPKETLTKILEAGQMTPSGANMQSWTVYAVSNQAILDRVTDAIISHIEGGGDLDQFIQYYPLKWINPYKLRRIKTGAGLYEKMGVDRKDTETRTQLWYDNYRWFGAKNVLFVFVDKTLIEGAQGPLIDSGAYMQTVMLAAQGYGIDSCPQGSTTEYGRIIAKALEVPENLALLYSIVLGYEDKEAIQNSYQPKRVSLDENVTFLD
ncbi:MAG: nitroreductase [Campylobacterota bacterium]|nr:nitroreductase [Campylobacterota bacterium]